MTPSASDILNKANKDFDKIKSDRQYLHNHAETGFDMPKTYEYVNNALKDMGYTPIPCGKSGLYVLAGKTDTISPIRTFLLRADMDAVRINNNPIHACGHDMHTAMLLGAARILKEYENNIPGIIKLMFQPAEETLEGCHDMINAGILYNPSVDAALMIHIITGVPLKCGTTIVCDGGVSAPAADYFTIEIKGKGCHGAMPNTGIDPITAASHIVIALQELHARELSIADKAVLTIGSFNAGSANNVIPDTAILSGTLRAFDEDVRKYIKERLYHIATHIAKAFRTEATVTFTNSCPTLKNDADLSACTKSYINELHLEINKSEPTSSNESTAETDIYPSNPADNEIATGTGTKTNTPKMSGSEDFSYISHEVPSIMVALAAGHTADGYNKPLHHPEVSFDENVLPIGSAIYAYTAIRWLAEHFHE